MPAVYRYEASKTNRAACQNTACKKDGVKIQKGELRFGTLVTIKEHDSWMWKHWGCVTPRQIGNVVEQLGGLEGLDLDEDLDILDGYDELPEDYQEKVKKALQDGHVADEDWKGACCIPDRSASLLIVKQELELNRPGQLGINKRTPRKKKTPDGETLEGDDGVPDETPTKPKTKKPGARSAKKKGEGETQDEEAAEVMPAKKKRAAPKKRKAADDADEDELAPHDDLGKVKPKRKPRAKKVKAEEDAGVEDIPEERPAKRSRTQKVKKEEEEEDVDADELALALADKPTRKPRAKKVKQEHIEDQSAPTDHHDVAAEPEESEEQPKPAKRGRPKKVKKEEEDTFQPLSDPTTHDQDDEDEHIKDENDDDDDESEEKPLPKVTGKSGKKRATPKSKAK